MNKKQIIIGAISLLVIACAVAARAVWHTRNRVQVEFNIHINKDAVYLSTYSEPPQFAVWLENPKTGKCKQVFVTYRVSRGDWEGKADVPVALPRWKAVFRNGDTREERSDEEIAVSGATPRNDYFRVRAEVQPGSEWICWIEMNLAGDFNEYYPQFNRITKEEDEFACGQPALLYRAEIKADEGLKYTPVAAFMSLWENGVNTLAPLDETITTATNVFDEISIDIIRPKPVIINKNNVEQQGVLQEAPSQLLGHRFLTLNTQISVNQIEATRTTDVGFDVRKEDMPRYHAVTPERVVAFREAIEKGFPGARISWGISWKALHDTTQTFVQIRQLIVDYHHQYGDDITLMPYSWFANVYNSVEQLNLDFHDGLAQISEMVGNGFRPKSVIAGFLASPNMEYLAKEEGIHVCQGNTWSQFSIDNQDGEGSISYPYYPSKEHFCKPAQGKSDFIDCVNLDAITMDFLSARREGFKEGNSRLGVGPIETLLFLGKEKGLKQMLHTTALHFDNPNFEANGFAWVTNMWELFLPLDYDGLTEWLAEIKKRWPDTQFITQGEFGLLWREHFKENSFDYRFVEKEGTGLSGSDTDKQIRWFMNKQFRLALLSENKGNTRETVIDFTPYNTKVSEPKELTRSWSLLGDINQKQTRPQDTPRPVNELSPEQRKMIENKYPGLTK